MTKDNLIEVNAELNFLIGDLERAQALVMYLHTSIERDIRISTDIADEMITAIDEKIDLAHSRTSYLIGAIACKRVADIQPAD